MHYDICLPWYWEYDIDFVQLVQSACHEQGLSLYQVTPDNVLEFINALYKGDVSFSMLLDRSQGDDSFLPINNWAKEYNKRRINPPELSKWSEDKATMHLELINAGIHTPYTILLASFIEQPALPQIDLSPLGHQFVIKPSNGGGGEGVILGASSSEQIMRARMEFPHHKYLLQESITPRTMQGRPAWFRIFYAAGEIYPCWWNPHTHVFATVTPTEENRYELAPLHDITKRIASICKLDWFTTEIALTREEFVVVDYVNDQIDTRIQSKAVDGAPDDVIRNVARQLVKLASAVE